MLVKWIEQRFMRQWKGFFVLCTFPVWKFKQLRLWNDWKSFSPHVPVPIRGRLDKRDKRISEFITRKLYRSVEPKSVTTFPVVEMNFWWKAKLHEWVLRQNENFLRLYLPKDIKTFPRRVALKQPEIFLYWKSWLPTIFHRNRCRWRKKFVMHAESWIFL